MKLKYQPNSELEKFGEKIYHLLVENFPQTFFVGGMTRDLLLGRTVSDIDIATSARPEQIIKVLKANNISYNDLYSNFGTVSIALGKQEVVITTFRYDLPGKNRYYKVKFANNPKIDSKRRDLTINSLYLSLYPTKILDFQKGLRDIKDKKIRFIGDPDERVKEDPLRIIRALRFALTLNFQLEKFTKKSIEMNFSLMNKLTKVRIQRELDKVKIKKEKTILKKIISDPAYLDKYFK